MPEKKTIARARADARAGKSASTQAGELVREEIRHVRRGKHGARSPAQAIAIGLSKARRAGIHVPAPKGASAELRARIAREERAPRHAPSLARSEAASRALDREPRWTVSHEALSKHAHDAAMRRTAAERSASAKKASRTKGAAVRKAAAKKAARTRARAA